MGVKILGVDTPLGSQAEVPFEPDVELPFKYGPGGFYKPSGVPSLVAPTAGARGTSLSALPDWRNPFTSPHVDPVTGQPEMLTGQGGIVDRNTPKNPMSWLTMGANLFGNKAKIAALAAAEATRATPVETGEFHPAMITGRPDAPWDTTHGLPAPAAALLPPARPVTPTPATAYPARPQQVTPAVAGPAAAAQQPNLGNYNPFTTVDRPNMSPQNSAQGRQGATQMGMLDLSRLFGGGQLAVNPNAPAVAAQPVSSPVAPGSGMSKAPLTMGPLQRGLVWPSEMGPKKRKSSTTSEGGGYNK